MRLYHGSTMAVRKPNILRGRRNTDFGKGFYCTTNYEQAARWARIKRDRQGTSKAVVTVYELDDNLLDASDFNIMRYHGATENWLDFVISNRRSSSPHTYDMVMGPVANDSLYATITMYEKGDLSAEAAIIQLRTHTLFDQLSFHTQAAVEMLKYIEVRYANQSHK